MSVHVIGRDAADAQIVLNSSAKRISRRHAELHVLGPDKFLLVDLKSANGTEVLEGSAWKKIERASVTLDTKVRFAREHELSVRDLLRLTSNRGGTQMARPGTQMVRPGTQMAAGTPVVGEGPTARPMAGTGRPAQAQGGQAQVARAMAAPAGGVAVGGTRLACAQCGTPMEGSKCPACGSTQMSRNEGLFGVIAKDAYDLGNRGGLLPVIGRLLRSPVSSTVELANDSQFNLHWPLFALGILIYVGLAEAIDRVAATKAQKLFDPTPIYLALGELLPPLKLLPEKAVYFGFIYAVFIFTFAISYSVLRDYSKRARSARSYLKLCCISSFVMQVASAALLTPIAAHFVGMLSPEWVIKVLWPMLLLFLVFSLQFVLRTTTRFWDISVVSAFRGMLMSFILALVVLALMFFLLVAVIATFKMWTGPVPADLLR